MLSLYDTLARKTYTIDRNTQNLAEKYFVAYRSLGGSIGKEKIMNDFLIVASTALKNMDIVVSEDNKTMLNDFSIKSYNIVNKLEKRRMPGFIGFDDFKKEIRRHASL